jgi:hypothetical protein
MPSILEMRELLDAIISKWPGDLHASGAGGFVKVETDAFAAAFRALAMIHRQPDLDSSHSAGHWVALANSRLHGQGATSYWPFLAAVLAWGDIAVTDWNLRDEGVPLEFGLNEFTGRLPRDEWRRTLRGEFATPIDPRAKLSKPSPRPIVLVDGRPLPDQMRYVGPRYVDF